MVVLVLDRFVYPEGGAVLFSVWRWVGGGQLVVVVFGFCTRNVCRVHRGVLDIRGRRDFSRFDPSPGRPHFSNFGPPAERRPFCENSPQGQK